MILRHPFETKFGLVTVAAAAALPIVASFTSSAPAQMLVRRVSFYRPQKSHMSEIQLLRFPPSPPVRPVPPPSVLRPPSSVAASHPIRLL